MCRNWTYITEDTECSDGWEFLIKGDADLTSGVADELLSLYSGFLEQPFWRVYDVDVGGGELEDALPASEFYTRSSERFPAVEQQRCSDDSGLTVSRLLECVSGWFEPPQFLTGIETNCAAVSVQFADSECLVGTKHEHRYRTSNYHQPTEYEPRRDPVEVSVRYPASYELSEYEHTAYRVSIWTPSDIWFADTPIGKINRQRLRRFIKQGLEGWSVIESWVHSDGWDNEEAARRLIDEPVETPSFAESPVDAPLEFIVRRGIDAGSDSDDIGIRDLLDNEAPDVRRRTVEQLAEHGEPPQVDSLLSVAFEDEAPEVQAAALRAVRAIADREDLSAADVLSAPETEALRSLLSVEPASVRAAAAALIAELDGVVFTQRLCELVKDGTSEVRAAAAEALWRSVDGIADPDAVVSVLAEAYASEPEGGVRLHLVQGVGIIGPLPRVDVLLDALTDPNEDVVEAAGTWLTMELPPTPTPERHTEVAERAREARPRLERLLDHRNEATRTAAEAVLSELDRKNT